MNLLLKKVKLAFGIFVLVLFFQNCTPVNFENGELNSNNNGGVYGGKPDATYYRFVPDFTCEQKEAPTSVIKIAAGQVLLTENKRLHCASPVAFPDLRLLDSSIYQNDVVGYLEGIFEGLKSEPSSIPANLVEVWCKDRNDEQGIETITHFDRLSNLAMNRTYFTVVNTVTNATPKIVDQSVSRVIDQTTITIRDGIDFELIVHRDQVDVQPGLFKAKLQTRIEGQMVRRDTLCRLGGSLDPKIWPVKQIVDTSVQAFKLSPDTRHFAYMSVGLGSVYNIYASNSFGSDQRKIGPIGSGGFLFAPDSKGLIYATDGNQPHILEINLEKSVGSLPSRLIFSDPLSSDWAPSEMIRSPDGSALIFLTVDALKGIFLKSVSLTGGNSITLTPRLSSFSNRYGFGVSTSQKKLVYFQGIQGKAPWDLSVANLDGSQISKVTVPIPADWTIDFSPGVIIPSNGDYAVFRASTEAYAYGNTGEEFQYFIYALDGSRSMALPKFWELLLWNKTGTHAIFVNNRPGIQSGQYLVNFQTGNFISLPSGLPRVWPGYFTSVELSFSEDSSSLITTQAGASGVVRAIAISTKDGAITELCPEASNSNLQVKEISSGQLLFLSYNTSKMILDVYLKIGSGLCKKVNSVPVEIVNQSESPIVLSPDHQKILVHVDLGSKPGSGKKLLYIPLDGKSSYIINSPAFKDAYLYDPLFLEDSKTVLFRGMQLPGSDGLYRWSAP